MFQRSQTCGPLTKPRLPDLALLETSRLAKNDDRSSALPKLKSARFTERQSRNNALTAPPKATFSIQEATNQPSPNQNLNHGSSDSQKKNPFQSKSVYLSNIKQRNTLKSRLIKEWAFKTLKNSDLGIETPVPVIKKKSSADVEKPSARLRNQSVEADKNLLNEEQIAIAKLEHHVDLKTLDDDGNERDFQMENRNPALNVSKAMSKRSQEARVLDNQLIELSKDRFKMLALMENQKKGFVDRQLFKSQALPGLK